MATGVIRLYSQTGVIIRSVFYSNKEDRTDILKRLHSLYGHKFETGYYHIIPYIKPELKVINMDINKKEQVINKRAWNEMDDFIIESGLIHETFYHRCYGG